MCGFGFAALAGVQIGGWAALGWVERILAVLYLVSALWMLLLGRSRFTEEFEAPTGSAVFGVAGTLSLYLLTIQRFCLVPTGIVRVGYTPGSAGGAGSLFVLHGAGQGGLIPGGKSGGWVFFTGMAAFLLCTCLALPGVVCEYLVGQAALAELIQAACIGLVGLSGLAYAFTAVGPAAEEITA